MTQLTLNLQGDLEATGEMKTSSSPVASRNYANHSHLPGNVKARMMNATCGAKCYEQFKKLNRDSSSLKMSLVSRTLMADWYSSRCALTWKLKGTKFNRLLFQLQPKTLRTEEIGAGLLLPTPTAMDSTNATATMKSTQVKEGSMHSVTLSRFLLTPSASDGIRAAFTMESLRRHNKPNAENSNLAEQIAHKVGGGTSHLNPRFIAEMMGFPTNWTELPFQSGDKNQSKDMATP
jgi:hypothetical protein